MDGLSSGNESTPISRDSPVQVRTRSGTRGRLEQVSERLESIQAVAQGKAEDIRATHEQKGAAQTRSRANSRLLTLTPVRSRRHSRTNSIAADALNSGTIRRSRSSSIAETVRSARKGEALLSPRQGPLTDQELEDLKLLYQFSKADSDVKPDEGQRKRLANLFIKARANPAVNAQMQSELEKLENAEGAAAPREMLELMKEFSYRTQDLDHPERDINQLETLLDRFYEGKPTANEAKMTMNQLWSLESFRKCGAACKLIERFHLDVDDPSGDLSRIIRCNNKATLLLGWLQNAMQRRSNLRSGDLMTTVPQRVASMRGTEMARLHQRQLKVQEGPPATHSALFFRNAEGEGRVSHILDNFEAGPVDLFEELSMVSVRIDPVKLFNPKLDPKLLKSLEAYCEQQGISVTDFTQELLADAIEEMHRPLEDNSPQVRNSNVTRFMAGLSVKLPILQKKLAKPRMGSLQQLQQGTAQQGAYLKWQENASAAQDQERSMICSHWVALSALAGIDRLSDKVLGHPGFQAFVKQQNGGRLARMFDRRSSKATPLFVSPIPDAQRLKIINPANLLTTMGASGCLSLVQPEAVLQGIVQADELQPPDAYQALCPGPSVGTPLAVDQNYDATVPAPDPEQRDPSLLSSKWQDGTYHPDGAKRVEAMRDEEVIQNIQQRRKEIQVHKLRIAERVKVLKRAARSSLRPVVKSVRENGSLEAVPAGEGGTYFARVEGRTVLVVKPDDEAPYRLNNGKGNATPLKSLKLRETIPPGNDAMRSRASFVIAQDLGLHCTPATEVYVMTSSSFHDVIDGVVDPSVKALGMPKRRGKLCCVQEFVPNSKSVEDVQDDMRALMDDCDWTGDLAIQRFVEAIDQQSLEEVVLLSCLAGETDGNPGNLLLVPTEAPPGHKGPFYAMMKIDNALSWPTQNGEFSMWCQGIPGLCDRPLSPVTRLLVRNLDEEKLRQRLEQHGFDDQLIAAAMQRVKVMKQVVRHADATADDLMTSVERGRDVVAAREANKMTQEEAEDMMAGIMAVQNTIISRPLRGGDSE